MSAKVNWVRDWLLQDYTGFDKKQITDAKKAFKAKATTKINAKIRDLNKRGAKISEEYDLEWKKERNVPIYFLVCYTNPLPVIISSDPDHGGGDSTVSPTRPPSP